MNVWGATTWCDFRCRTAADMRAVIDFAHAHGGVCSINHPKPGGPAWEYDFELPIESMEVWQGPWVRDNGTSLALWDQLLCQGRRLPGVGGSDFHCPDGPATTLSQLGQPLTWVYAKPSVDGILSAICAGRVSISAGPAGPRVFVQGRYGGQTAQMGDSLQCPAGAEIDLQIEVCDGIGYDLHVIVDGRLDAIRALTGQNETIELTIAPSRYVRAEVVGDGRAQDLPPERPANLDLRNWRWALSNPIYIQTEAGSKGVDDE